MTAGTSRIRKTGTAAASTHDSNKQINDIDHVHADSVGAATQSPVSDNIDILTNDHGDKFYERISVSSKLGNSFEARISNNSFLDKSEFNVNWYIKDMKLNKTKFIFIYLKTFVLFICGNFIAKRKKSVAINK